MNIKSDTFNPGSLVLGGPSLHSYCLLWFIHRCTHLFDMLSWEVFAPVWGEKMLWKLEMDLPDSQSDGNRRKIYVMLMYICVCVCVYVAFHRSYSAVLTNSPECQVKPFGLASSFITFLLKIGWLEDCHRDDGGLIRCQRFSLLNCVYSFFQFQLHRFLETFFPFQPFIWFNKASHVSSHLTQNPGILSESTF